MSRKANKGEWSEPYAALRILGDKRLHIADADGNKNANEWLTVLALMRTEAQDRVVRYQYDATQTVVDVTVNDLVFASIPVIEFVNKADSLMAEIVGNRGASFSIAESLDEWLMDAGFSSLKAKSKDKSDIHIDALDPRSGVVRNRIGFSIKSEFGQPPTLFNTAVASACIYELEGFTDAEAKSINDILTPDEHVDVRGRCRAIMATGKGVKFVGHPYSPRAKCKPFYENLDLINPHLTRVFGFALWDSFIGVVAGKDLTDVLDYLVKKNPLKLTRPKEKYAYMLKSFLYATYCGMTASTIWDGRSEVNGGFIRVSRTGEVLAFYALESDSFKEYLFKNCFLEFPSTSERHGHYGKVYEEGGKYYFRLNFQIRYRVA